MGLFRLSLKDEIETKVSRLRDNPRLYKVGRVDGKREIVVPSNYLVVFAENAHTVTILRVLHAAQQWLPTCIPELPTTRQFPGHT